MSTGFSRMADTTASTKRNPPVSGGKITAPVTNLTALEILPLMPVSQETVQFYKLQSPRENYVTYTIGAPDVIEGDVLTVASVDYRVVAVQPWPSNYQFLEIVVQRLKAA